MRPEFEDYNIQSEAKTLDDIKRAAITTEKVLHAKSSQLNVNVISHRDIMGLPDTMKLLMKKVENLNEENRFIKENFGNHVSDKSFPNQKTNNNPQNPKFTLLGRTTNLAIHIKIQNLIEEMMVVLHVVIIGVQAR